MNARRLAAAVLLVASGTALAVLCWRGLFVRYNADDFWTASVVARRGFWGSQRFWYQRWSGRFSYTFLIGIVESIGPRIVPALVPITIASWFAATFLLLKRISRLEWLSVAALASAIVYATAEGTVDVPQSILWQTGLLTYVVPMVGWTAWLATSVDRTSIHGSDAIAPFVLAGFSETTALCQIAALAALTIAIPQRRRTFTVALAASICAVAVMGFAPGNAVRLSVAARPNLLWIAGATLRGTAMFFVSTAATSGIALLVVFVAATLLAPRATRRVAAAAVGAALCGALFTILAAAATLSVAPPSRTLIVPYFLVVVATATLGAALRLPLRLEPVAIALLLLLSAGGPLVAAAMRARNLGDAAAFAAAWDRLDGQLRRNRGREVIVANASGSAGTLSFITHDPDAWSNRCIADYYALGGIAAAPPRRIAAQRMDLPVYATEEPRHHDQGDVVQLRFGAQ